ncbi:O-antigen ligase family protein [Marinitoga litoralis]|uniref:O-antigen ligase family protein n=1 Tax=Marinitoga litoralis TaxID=570855 RepID=UPI00196192E6|nr:O-antigen ligase family protein [Marinitoga litoralis]MBM7560336.1 O-antigen ligase [Marinitoga litoralis]
MKLISLKLKRFYSQKEIYIFFILGYVFLSGFVFIEPSPAELWFVLFLPFFLICTKLKNDNIKLFLLLFIPLFVSTLLGYFLFGFLNLKFFGIDIYLFLLFLFLISYNISENTYKYLLKKIIIIWTISGLINVFIGLFAYATGRSELLGTKVIRFSIRLVGFFKDPNVLGPFLIIPALYLFEEFYKSKKGWIKKIIILFFLSLGILLSFSRAAWLNYFIGVFIIIFAYALKNKTLYNWKTLLALSLLLVVIISLFTIDMEIMGISFKSIFKSRLGIKSYDMNRFKSQAASLNMLKMNLLSGIGPGNYEEITNYSAHNTFLRYLGERGLLGIITLYIFLIYIFLKAYQIKDNIFLLASLTGLMINSYIVDTLHWRHMWILFVLIILKEENKNYEL